MKNTQLTFWLICLFFHFAEAQNGVNPADSIGKKSISTKSDAKKQALKVSPLAFLSNYTSIAYEKSLKQGRSFELKLVLIGAGVALGNLEKTIGATATIGYKFIQQPTEAPKKNRYQHVLRGRYFRPDFTLAFYTFPYKHDFYEPNNIYPTTKTEKLPIFYASLMPTIGSQKVWRNGLVADIFIGAGLAAVVPMNGDHIISNTNHSQVIILNRLSDKKFGIAPTFKAGFLMGGLF